MIIVTRQGHFRASQAEYVSAAIVLLLGLVLLHPEDTFLRQSFQWFAGTSIPETMWGVLFSAIGALRLVSIYVNGRRATLTAWSRGIGAGLCFMVFLLATVGFFARGEVTTAWAVYPVLAVSELFSLYFAMLAAGASHCKEQQRRDALRLS